MTEIRAPGPCCICGLTNYSPSMGGPTICPKCDCGMFDAATVMQQAKVIEKLRAEIVALAATQEQRGEARIEAAARAIFNTAVGPAQWDNKFYAEEREGCVRSARAAIAAADAVTSSERDAQT